MKKNIVNRNKEGQLHGKQIGYRDNGNKWYEEHFVNGKQHGVRISYFKNGNKRSETNYVYGKSHGVHIFYYSCGSILFKRYRLNETSIYIEDRRIIGFIV